MKIINSIYIVVFLLIIFSCGNKTEATAEKSTAHEHGDENTVEVSAQQAKNAGIRAGNIEMRQLSGSIRATGMLDVPPQNLVSVTATIGGFLQSTELLQGVRVKKGQVIAVLKSNDYIQVQQEYLESRSKLEFLEAEYKRQELLAKDNVNAQKTLQQAKADYEGIKARTNGLKARLQMAGANIAVVEKGEVSPMVTITSPINGYVTQVNVNLGAFITPGTEMFRIVDTEHLHAEIRIFERDLHKIKTGNLVYFNLAHESINRKAHVYLIGREIEPDRTVRIHCHLDKEDPELLPGMYITATIETQNGLVPALPDEAIVLHENKKYIFISEKSHIESGDTLHSYRMLEVATGLSEFGYTEVLLPAGTDAKSLRVVTHGAFVLLAKKYNSEEEGHGH